MEALTKKTTILFSLKQYDYLRRLAKRRQTSVGDLVRTACKEQYGESSVEDRIKAAKALGRMSLPVDDVEVMEQQSVPKPHELLP